MTTDTALTIAVYIVAGWIALLAIQRLRNWKETSRRDALWDCLIHAAAVTVAIAYLIWWPLLIAVTWQWLATVARRRGPG